MISVADLFIWFDSYDGFFENFAVIRTTLWWKRFMKPIFYHFFGLCLALYGEGIPVWETPIYFCELIYDRIL